MKSIFVPAGGGETGEAVFVTAFAVAQPLGAHLEFFHALKPFRATAARVPD